MYATARRLAAVYSDERTGNVSSAVRPSAFRYVTEAVKGRVFGMRVFKLTPSLMRKAWIKQDPRTKPNK